MTKEEIRDYSVRISQCSKTELVVITYDIAINYINSAIGCFNNDDMEGFTFNIKKSREFILDLSSNLDFKYKISFELMSLYLFINKTLLEAMLKKNIDNVDACIEMLTKLKGAFEKIAPEDVRGQAMPNSEQVYVGLTYGKGSILQEVRVR